MSKTLSVRLPGTHGQTDLFCLHRRRRRRRSDYLSLSYREPTRALWREPPLTQKRVEVFSNRRYVPRVPGAHEEIHQLCYTAAVSIRTVSNFRPPVRRRRSVSLATRAHFSNSNTSGGVSKMYRGYQERMKKRLFPGRRGFRQSVFSVSSE